MLSCEQRIDNRHCDGLLLLGFPSFGKLNMTRTCHVFLLRCAALEKGTGLAYKRLPVNRSYFGGQGDLVSRLVMGIAGVTIWLIGALIDLLTKPPGLASTAFPKIALGDQIRVSCGPNSQT